MNTTTSRNYWLLAAGLLNLFTFTIHLFVGQLDLINPLESSALPSQVKTELLGAWHLVSLLLLMTALTYLYGGFKYHKNHSIVYKGINVYYILGGLVFVFISFINHIFAPQWILLIPTGVVGYFGMR